VIHVKVRMRRLLLAAFLLLPCCVSGSQEYSIDWLELSEDVLESWVVEISADRPSELRVSPKWKKRDTDIPKRIAALVPKESSSYSLAATELLRVLHDQGIYADLCLINFGNDIERGREILKSAELDQADLIFSMGSESADLVHRYYSGGKIPVVTCTNKDPVMLGQVKDYDSGSGTNIAYTTLNVPLAVQKDYLFRLKPKLVNIGLLYDRNHVQVMATEVVPAQQTFRDIGVNVIDITVDSSETARWELVEKLPKAIAEMRETDPDLSDSVFWLTSSTSIFSNMDLVSGYCKPVPVLSSIPNAVTEGEESAVIAIGIDRRNNAHLAAIYAVRILKGEVRPGALPVGVVTPPDVAINFRVARKIRLEIPFSFFESAAFIYDYEGKLARAFGETVK
jgi:putative ABC transport system substrate-binding protein